MNAVVKKIVQSVWFSRGKVPWLNFPLPCVLPFGSWYLAYGDGMGLMFFFRRPFESNEWPFVQAFLKPGMTVIDVGANQGFYTLLAAKQVGPQGNVVSFEPVPSQVRKLQRNIAINRFHNVVVQPQAVGSQPGLADMNVCLDGDEALSSLRSPAQDVSSTKKVITVPVITLDQYVGAHHITSVDFIKIDVEGGELPVLQGAVNIVESFRPVFMCEVQDIRTQPWGYAAAEICTFLENHRYRWFSVAANGLLQSSTFKERHETRGENLIAVPQEKMSLVSTFLEIETSLNPAQEHGR